jgi:hypothetical protein
MLAPLGGERGCQGTILMRRLPPMRMLFNPAHEEPSNGEVAAFFGRPWRAAGRLPRSASRVSAEHLAMHPIAPRSVSEQRLTALRPWERVLIEIQVQILHSHEARHLREMPVCHGSQNSVQNETTWQCGRRRNTNAYLQT